MPADLEDNLLLIFFEGLARKTLSGNSSELSASEVSEEGWLPKVSPYDKTKQNNLYIAIGKFMGICLTSSGSYSTVIGKVFDPAVFDVIEAASPPILKKGFENLDDNTLIALYSALENNKKNKLLNFYNTQNFNTCDEETLREMVTYAYVEDPEEMPAELEGEPTKASILKHQGAIRAKLKSQIVTYAKENDSLPLILKIAEGIAEHYYQRNSWSHQNWGINNLEQKIQGRFDKQAVKNALQTWSSIKILGYLNKWIDESDKDMVQKFVKAVTGSNTLAYNSTIRVEEFASSKRLPVYHTCSRQVDIPSYTDYNTFKTKLEQSFDCLDENGFQMQ